MSFLDDLSRAAESPASVWHQFVVAHDARRDDWYVFLEGKLDVSFYVAALRAALGDKRDSRIHEFRCSGKVGVLTARDDVRKSHPGCGRSLFFVDKDLQDVIPDGPSIPADVFCTNGYSIENYLVHEESLGVVWAELWSMATNDSRRQVVVERFRSALARFYKTMGPVMAWIVLAKKSGLRPNLSNVNLGDIIVMDECMPRRVPQSLAQLMRSTSCPNCPTFYDVLNEAKRLRRLDPKRIVRGKFELWFFCRFLDSVFRTLRLAPGEKPSGSIQLSPESLARALVGKIAVPSDLQEFLRVAVLQAQAGHCERGV